MKNTNRSAHLLDKLGLVRRAIILVSVMVALAGSFIFTGSVLGYGPNPHGGYTATTGDCAACHRAHTGAGARLLHNISEGNVFCSNCHDGGDAPLVATHGNIAIGGGEEDPFELECAQCHTPHGDTGNLYNVREEVRINPLRGTVGPVTFTAITGTNSYDDGTNSGVCVTCHINSNNQGYPMSRHPDGDHGSGMDYRGQDCTTCHLHTNGFIHGGGEGCITCHGHDAGTLYDPDATGPYTPGTEAGQGRGSFESHSTHTEIDSDDLRGPGIYCDTCHDTSSFPNFNSGTDVNGDGKYNLAETDVCDACHSPNGTYNGVNDAVIGAKNNWDSGVYNGNSLMAGKEKWCAGCHDEAPSQIQGVNAPNVIGDEDGAYTYGEGWGYYKTGHGLPFEEPYPSKGGMIFPPLINGAARAVECDGCHDFSTAHIDGLPRTFDDGGSSDTDPGVYRQGYRLKLVNGQEPLQIPWKKDIPGLPNEAARYRLCVSCHDAGPFTDSANMNTNLVTWGIPTAGEPDEPINRHKYHLEVLDVKYAADWDPGYNGAGATSRITCMACHNVHGSTKLAMVRDGKLTDREPGLNIWYFNADLVFSYNSPPVMEPVPPDVPLVAGEGTIWHAETSSNLCSHCHYNNSLNEEPRNPYLDVTQTPMLTWTREVGYFDDGVDPESAKAGSNFTFRVKYTDKNNDTPTPIELWVDENDNGGYETGEKYALTGADPSDHDYTDGRLYTLDLPLSKAGDNTFIYRFFASDGTLTDQTPTRTVIVANNPPTLTWTVDTYFENDGVHPDTAANGSNFEFRVKYTDLDGDAPNSIQVWIDANENGSYEPGEMHTMSAGSGNYATGRLYSYNTTLNYVVDGVINYTFRANDGTDNAVAESGPLSDNDVTVTSGSNNPPVLDWAVAACSTNGVKPVRGLAFGDYQFSVKYTDLDNQCPPTNGYVRVWVDRDDDGLQDAGETYDLTAATGNCSAGKVYSTTVTLPYNGDGNLKYQFSASDGTDTAGGVAAFSTGNEVTVVDPATAIGVRTGSTDFGPLWYNQIQTAVEATSNKTILVYEGTYNENVRLDNNPAGADVGISLESVCGPEVTTINASGSTVFIETIPTNTILDGFTVTGGSNGININGAYVTVKDSIIRNNSRGIYSGSSSNRVIVEDSIIRNNVGAGSGAGIYYHDGSGPHSLTNTIIRDNASTGSGVGEGNGGGLFMQNVGTGISIENCTITGNNANLDGGGIHINNSIPVIRQTYIDSNTSGAGGGGIFMYGSTSSIILENSNVTNNTAAGTGGGLHLHSSGITANIINSTISDNKLADTSGGQGGGIFANTINASITNSILWGNAAAGKESGHEIFTNNGIFNFTNSDVPNNNNALVKSGVAGSFNIDSTNIYTDPLFIAPLDYHLKSISPAVNQGTAAGAPSEDIEGDARPQGSGFDMGSDEVLVNSGPTLAWTGESNYADDGVHPESVAGGSTFAFRVQYTDADNTGPTSMQVWVDLNDDGDYEDAGEKENMSRDGGDGNYANGENFTRSFTLYYIGDGSLKYTFRASDGANDATGMPTTDKTLVILNNAPTLAWEGTGGYITDGADPDTGTHGITFTFKINYADVDNNAPSAVQVWIDQNDNSAFESGEKYTMTLAAGGDGNYATGEIFTTAVAARLSDGNSDGIIAYRFYGKDSSDATGPPTANQTITLTNIAPTLGWPGSGNYINDGVDPDSASSGSPFEFRVVYTDADNNAPELLQVWVDEDDSGTYEGSEKYTITETINPDAIYSNGETYSRTLTIHDPGVGDGILTYRFYATDGGAVAAGDPPVNGGTLALSANVAPTLDWQAGGCRTEGVSPRTGAGGADYEFLVNYTDADNSCPASGSGNIQVWVDVDDNGYDDVEKLNLTGVSAADTDCSDGKLYSTNLTLNGTGNFNYRFYASDGAAEASGPPAADSVVSVINAIKVRQSGGTGWQTTIQAGVDASSDGSTILVYPKDDFTAETYYEDVFVNTAQNNRTLQAACGPDLTIIDGTSSAVATQHNSNLVIDGFTLTGAGDGVNVNDTAPLTIKNCRIQGNSHGINSFDTRNQLTVSNCEIYNNTTAGDGGGIYINGGSTHQIISTTLTGNSGRNGGGLYCQSACQVSIQNSTINGNTGTSGGGGVYLLSTGSRATLVDTFIQGNDSGSNGGGGIYIENGTSADMTNVVLTGNRTTGLGGAVNERGYAGYLFCTLSGNYANNGGGAIYHLNPAVTTIRNSIIYNNNAGSGGPAGKDYQIFTNNHRWSSMDVYNTLINQAPSTGSWPDVAGYEDMGGNNIYEAPGFVNGLNPAAAPTTGGDYHIQSGSPCVNAGSSGFTYDHDIDGDSRPQDGGYDMGADEVAPAAAMVVDNLAAAFVGEWPSGANGTALLSIADFNAYASDFRYHAAGDGKSTATWTPLLPQAGIYNVYAWWVAAFDRATDAPYTIHYDGGSETVRVNQEINGGRWNLLGSYLFAAGTSGFVQLSDDANEYISADAVMFEFQSASAAGFTIYLPIIVQQSGGAKYTGAGVNVYLPIVIKENGHEANR